MASASAGRAAAETAEKEKNALNACLIGLQIRSIGRLPSKDRWWQWRQRVQASTVWTQEH